MHNLLQVGTPHEAATTDTTEDKVMRLFAAPDDFEGAEAQMESRLSAITRAFVGGRGVSSEIEYEKLARTFCDSRIPDEPCQIDAYLDYLEEHVVAHSTNTASPRFIGHMTSGLPFFVRPLAKTLAAMNQNVVKAETSKASTPYERQALAMIHRLIYDQPEEFYRRHVQNKESTLGVVVSGGTLANITALWCARNVKLGAGEGFGGVQTEGLAAALDFHGYSGAVIVGSELMHYSIDKAADFLGIGSRNLLKVRTDGRHRIDLVELRRLLAECRADKRLVIAIIGIAGTTDTGAIDPLRELADIAREGETHFHVDAAWGGPVLFSKKHRHKLAGIERADSVTIDGHKQMYLPMGLGVLALRDPGLARVVERQARYIIRPNSVDLGKRSLEGSRPGVSLYLHAALNIIGASGYEYLIDEGIARAEYMADCIEARPEFELLAAPQINILVYRCLPEPLREKAARLELTEDDNRVINRFNERLQKAQRSAGRSFVSRTSLSATRYGPSLPIVGLRSVLANPLTKRCDIRQVLEEQSALARELSFDMSSPR